MWSWKQLKQIFKADQGDFSDSAVIVWPVSISDPMAPSNLYPVNPHVTVFFFPDVVGDNISEDALVRIIQGTEFAVYPVANVKGLAWFGPEQNVPVLELDNDYLVEYRDELKGRLDRLGINYSQRFPDYKPHVTITTESAESGEWPSSVLLQPVELWYREEKIRIFK